MSETKKVKVSALYIMEEKGEPVRGRESVTLKKQGGLLGDRHCEDTDHPVSISSEGICEWMKAESTEGLCFRRFKANILLEGTEGIVLEPGMRLQGKETVLEITGKKGPCFAECARYSAGLGCRLKEECWFARGESGGKLETGEYLKVFKS